MVPQGSVEAYEVLRPRLAESLGNAGGGVILLRRGMLAWAREQATVGMAAPIPVSPVAIAQVPAVAVSEMVRLMAALVLSKGVQYRHA